MNCYVFGLGLSPLSCSYFLQLLESLEKRFPSSKFTILTKCSEGVFSLIPALKILDCQVQNPLCRIKRQREGHF